MNRGTSSVDPSPGTARRITRRLTFRLARAFFRLGQARVPALFVIGHMRCGSSLLLHLLLTSHEIIACGERNATYRSLSDLDKLEFSSRIVQRAPFRRCRYAVDQINHNKFILDLELLSHKQVRCIFLIRNPQDTIQSIVHLTRVFYKPWSTEQAVDYYSERLEMLVRYAEYLQGRRETMALTYEALVNETPSALRRLESFLELNTTLTEHYALQPFTGERGDPSPNIRAGVVVDHRVSPTIDIPTRDFERALAAYRRCTRAFGLNQSSECRS